MKASIQELAGRRYSCRRYLDRSLEDGVREELQSVLASLTAGPLGNRCRFTLVASSPGDGEDLRGLGTYGFIRGAAGFIVGVVRPAPHDMEDYGYCLERAVLEATDLGLGTCWLGGTFTRSSFARRVSSGENEVIPAVIALGYPEKAGQSHWIRRMAGGSRRLPPEQLFFEGRAATPLSLESVGAFANVLEAVRWAPSASNKQPWRLVHADGEWHFFLHRTSDPRKSGFHSILKIEDLQRVDMGIAMCHFDLAAREQGSGGEWTIHPSPSVAAPVEWQYTATWRTR